MRKRTQNPSSLQDLASKLAELSKPQLIDIFLKMSSEDEAFMRHIEHSAYLVTSGTTPKFHKLVSTTLDKYRDEVGHLDWKSLATIHQDLSGIIKDSYQSQKLEGLITLCIEVIVQVNQELMRTDDSNGELSDLIDFSFGIMGDLIDEPEFIQQGLRSHLYRSLLDTLDAPEIYGWNCAYMIWDLLSHVVETRDELNALSVSMENAIAQRRTSFKYDYLKEHATCVRAAILSRIGTDDEVEELLVANKRLPDVRELLVRRHMSRAAWQEARILLLDGIEQAIADDHPGTRDRWELLLYEIAKQTDDEDTIRAQAKHILLTHSFKMDHFIQYKNLIPIEQWPLERDEILIVLKEKNTYSKDLDLMSIYAYEGLLDTLFKAVTTYGTDLYILDQYAKELYNHDPDGLAKAYLSRIESFLHVHASRKYYAVAARYFRKLIKWGYKAEVSAAVEKIRTQYAKRRALLEELAGL